MLTFPNFGAQCTHISNEVKTQVNKIKWLISNNIHVREYSSPITDMNSHRSKNFNRIRKPIVGGLLQAEQILISAIPPILTNQGENAHNMEQF